MKGSGSKVRDRGKVSIPLSKAGFMKVSGKMARCKGRVPSSIQTVTYMKENLWEDNVPVRASITIKMEMSMKASGKMVIDRG